MARSNILSSFHGRRPQAKLCGMALMAGWWGTIIQPAPAASAQYQYVYDAAGRLVAVAGERCNLFPDGKPFPHSFVGASVSSDGLVTFVPGGRAASWSAFFPTSVSSPVGLLPLLFRGCLLTKFLQDPNKTKEILLSP